MSTLFHHVNDRHFSSQLRKTDSNDRLEALEALTIRGDARVLVEKALSLLNDDEAEVRERAASAIGSIQTREAAQATIERWESFGEDGLNAAIQALSSIGKQAVATVRKELYHSNPRIRAAAVETLGRIEARTVVNELSMALADQDARVVCAAARALGRHQAEKCIDDLMVVYRRRPETRLAIIDAFAAIASPPALSKLRAAADDDDADVRKHAQEALAALQG